MLSARTESTAEKKILWKNSKGIKSPKKFDLDAYKLLGRALVSLPSERMFRNEKNSFCRNRCGAFFLFPSALLQNVQGQRMAG